MILEMERSFPNIPNDPRIQQCAANQRCNWEIFGCFYSPKNRRISPERCWLGDCFLVEMVPYFRWHVNFLGGRKKQQQLFFPAWCPTGSTLTSWGWSFYWDLRGHWQAGLVIWMVGSLRHTKKKLSYLTSRDLPSFLRGERLNFRVYMGGWVVEDWLASLPMDEDVVGVYLWPAKRYLKGMA